MVKQWYTIFIPSYLNNLMRKLLKNGHSEKHWGIFHKHECDSNPCIYHTSVYKIIRLYPDHSGDMTTTFKNWKTKIMGYARAGEYNYLLSS